MNCSFTPANTLGRFYCPICDPGQEYTVPIQDSMRVCGPRPNKPPILLARSHRGVEITSGVSNIAYTDVRRRPPINPVVITSSSPAIVQHPKSIIPKNCLRNRTRLLTTPPPRVSTQEGVGTELKTLLALIGIKESDGCNCSKRSKIMNAQGIQWCQDNIETIVDWMQEEAKKRKLPFVRIGAKLIVKRAIRNARKKGNP